jgi:branched-chain amino acid transport system substrate-binding protein
MRLPPLAAVLAGLLLLAAAPPAGAQNAPIRIGASLSLTGTYAKPGVYGREGYAFCQKQINEGAGVMGRPIEMVVYDDRSDPQTGVRLYEKLITEDRVELVLGPYSSAITEAVANVTEKYKKLMLAPLGSAGSIWEKGRRYVIMMVSPAEVYLEGLIDIAARNGLKSIALIYEDTLFPKTTVNGAVALARKRGLEVVLQEALSQGADGLRRPPHQDQGGAAGRARGGDLLRRRGGDHAADAGARRQREDVRLDRGRRSPRVSQGRWVAPPSTCTGPRSGSPA